MLAGLVSTRCARRRQLPMRRLINEVALRSAVGVLLVPMILAVLVLTACRGHPGGHSFSVSGGAPRRGPYPPGAKGLALSALAVDSQDPRTLFAIPAACKLDKSTD